MIGLALAAASYDLPEDVRARVLARLGGALGEEARGGEAELARGKGAKDTRVVRAAWAAAARVPAPPGLRAVHATWLEHALRDLPHAARGALASGKHTKVEVWLARWACADIPPMPTTIAAGDCARPIAAIEHVLAWPEAPLAAWLTDVGADQLAMSVTAAGGVLAAQVARRFPAVGAAQTRIAVAPRAGRLGPTRAAIERCTAPHDEHLLLRIGARAIAPHLARAAVAYAAEIVALRLPRPAGLVVLAELRARAADPIDRAPAWPALSA